ncbi:cobalamin B12-binding domain-containing protein [Acidisoma cladoniae]|uniref:cobalamin B12-binding domain-containing protein n=1 Tax=Acidisoma cladoniae TaxID=3040935 RepID=UPI00254F4886|nr:cobalamin B12-binding domain-containing protein [Acidisoma sp. PAMC 29798]
MPGLNHQEVSSASPNGQTSYELDTPPVCRTTVSILYDERSRQRRQAAIERMVETDIIPRLVAAYRLREATTGNVDPRTPKASAPRQNHTAEDAISLAMVVIGETPEEAIAAVIERLIAEGEAPEAGCLELIADAARHLGVLWTEDKAGFEEVTIGMFHLQRMAHDIAPMTRRVTLPAGVARKTLLLLTLEGEQHNLAKTLLANCFDSAGWQVSTVQVSSTDDVAGLVSKIDYDVVGFSMATDVQINRANTCIKAVRRASHNRNVIIMVGGALILATPSLVETLGADGTAASAAVAIVRAEELLNQLRRPKASPSSALR